MKALYTEQYYRDNWERLINVANVHDDNYINVEGEFESRMKTYEGLQIPEEVMVNIRNVEAKKVVEECGKKITRQMKILNRLDAGVSSLGYTTRSQESYARAVMRKRFEFNCLQLSDFRKKYEC